MKAEARPETAERILACATQLTSSEGPGALSMRRVASCAGISATAIYRHFASKEELLAAVAEAGRGLLARRLDAAMAAGDALARLRATTTAYLGFALEHRHDYRVLFMTARGAGGERDREDVGSVLSFVTDRVRDCQRAGVLGDADPAELALTIWSHCHGLVSLHLVAPRGSDADFEALCRRSIARVITGLQRPAAPH